ncbi:MAG: CoA transferase [Candidatus Binataceae bacterium]
MAKALDGVTVLEFAGHLGSAYAAMLMAEQGARTIKIEPRDGEPIRGTPHFHALNRSKQALFLDLDSAADLAQAHELMRIADVVLSGFTPARQRSLGLDYESVHRINPSALLLQMPPLGSRGPYAEMPADNDLLGAWGGIFGTQSAVSGKPVAMTFPMASYQAGLLGAAAATAGLIARDNGEGGKVVELSGLAAALSMQTGDFMRNPGLHTSRPGPADPMGPFAVVYLYRCADGLYFILDCTSARFCQRLAEAIGRPALFSDPRFKDAPWGVPKAHVPALREALQEAFLERPRDEWVRILREYEVPNAPVMTRHQFLDDPQVRHLGIPREVDDPTLGRTIQTGPPVKLSATPGDIVGPAPALDNGNPSLAALLEEARNTRNGPAVAQPSRPPSSKGPLAGVTVIDFSSYIAGSFCPMVLAQMGADVIKVEGRDGDSLRHVTGFRGWNQNKRGLGLDLKSPQGLEIAHALVKNADVVVENFRPGRTRAYGIDYERLSAINPRLIYMSVTGYGSSGPDYDRPGLDPLAQALSGSMAAHSGEGRGPAKPGDDSPRHPIYLTEPITDYGAATLAALGCILALRARQVTGKGQYCETTLLQAVAALQTGEFIFYSGRPNLEIGAPELRGTSALHCCYQCQDGDWLYLSIADAARWDALRAQVPGIESMSFAQARSEGTDGNLARILTEYFASRPAKELLDSLFAKGVTVAPAAHISRLFDDPQVIANEMTVDVEEAELGVVRQSARFATFPGVTSPITPAPRLGEHSDQILTDMLGYDAARIKKLRDAGVIFGPL